MILGIDFISKSGLGLDPSSTELYCTRPIDSVLRASRSIWSATKLWPWINSQITEDSELPRRARPWPSPAILTTPFKGVHHWYKSINLDKLQWKSSIALTFWWQLKRILSWESVGELNVNEMTMNLEQTALSTPTKITEENKKYILDNAKLDVPDEFRQRYIFFWSIMRWSAPASTTWASVPPPWMTSNWSLKMWSTSSSSEFQKLNMMSRNTLKNCRSWG